jgi:nucleoid DNA-binding protein
LVHEIVQRTFAAVTEALVREQRLELRDFGVFEVRVRAARKVRNPRTNERLDLPSRVVVAFRAGREMTRRVGALPRDEVSRRLRSHLSRGPGELKVPPRPDRGPRPSATERSGS